MEKEITLDNIAAWVDDVYAHNDIWFQVHEGLPSLYNEDDQCSCYCGKDEKYMSMGECIREHFSGCELLPKMSWRELCDTENGSGTDSDYYQFCAVMSEDEFDGQDYFVKLYGKDGHTDSIIALYWWS